jgi:predicted anti-sigma-YlaC factor YlaD
MRGGFEMAERCAQAWRLFCEIERQINLARLEQVDEDEYPPYVETITRYRSHLRSCPQCRAMLNELREISERKESKS